MRLRINHETEYLFEKEVFFEPHYFRFKPGNNPNIEIESFHLEISPRPSGLITQIDAENNLNHFAWFEGLHKKLAIKAETTLHSQDYNPFNFIIFPSFYSKMPFSYDKVFKSLVEPSLFKLKTATGLINFGKELLAESGSVTIDFILNLTRRIHSGFIIENRETGSPLHPDETFSLKKGSCRDLSWMMIQLLRNMGIAARFVSGYYYIPLEKPDYELHAWVEVFIPGAGWLGFDPSHGIITANSHIPVSASSHHNNTMPVSGNTRGDGKSELSARLEIIEI